MKKEELGLNKYLYKSKLQYLPHVHAIQFKDNNLGEIKQFMKSLGYTHHVRKCPRMISVRGPLCPAVQHCKLYSWIIIQPKGGIIICDYNFENDYFKVSDLLSTYGTLQQTNQGNKMTNKYSSLKSFLDIHGIDLRLEVKIITSIRNRIKEVLEDEFGTFTSSDKLRLLALRRQVLFHPEAASDIILSWASTNFWPDADKDKLGKDCEGDDISQLKLTFI